VFPQLANAQSALVKQHKCHPLATALVPPIIHIPIFLLLSLTIRQASALATPTPIDLTTSLDAPVPTSEYAAFASEHTLWLTSLVDPDPQLVIPFAIGLMAFANVEVMQSWRKEVSGAAAQSEPTNVPQATQSGTKQPVAASNKIRPNFGRISPSAKRSTSVLQNEHDAGNMSAADSRRREVDLKAGTMRERVVGNVMRILSVVTVGIAAEVPAVSRVSVVLSRPLTLGKQAVAIYWFTSTGYTLVQNIILGYLDRRAAPRAIQQK
jgi:hypothetical protein